MEEILRDLYWKNVETMDAIRELVRAVRIQNPHRMVTQMSKVTACLTGSLSEFAQGYPYLQSGGLPWEQEALLSEMKQIAKAQEEQDFVLMADFYEQLLLPSLQDMQNAILALEIPIIREEWLTQNLSALGIQDPRLAGAIRRYPSDAASVKDDSTKYALEPTTIGCFTLAVASGADRRYLCSNVNPIEEARLFAERVYRLEEERYLVIGWGMAYHIRELLRMYPEMDLVIVEPDIGILYHSLSCQDARDILEHVRILWKPDWRRIGSDLRENRELVCWEPELFCFQEADIRKQFSDILYRKAAIEDVERLFYQNTRENIRSCDGYVDALRPMIEGKRVVIAAGGPSLDKNLDQLKDKPDDVILIAVGTVFRQLLAKGIPIDYVIASDVQMFPQIEGLERQTIPFLLLASADRRVSRRYQGKTYLICQQGYSYAAEYAKAQGYTCYDSGGSVATLALDVAIRMKAASIAFVGLDLAMDGTRYHATGTLQETLPDFGYEKVEGIDGGKVSSSKAFIRYRLWMERRITQPDVTMPVVDATEGGAKKKGFTVMTLHDWLHGKDDTES